MGLLTGGEVPPQFEPLGSSNGLQTRLHELGSSKAAQDILHGLLKRSPEQRFTAAEAVMHHWTKATRLQPVPVSTADQDENIDAYHQLGNIQHPSPSIAVPMHIGGMDFANSPSADFTVF